MNKRRIIVLIILLFMGHLMLRAQTTHGVVLSSEDQLPVTGAIARFVGKTGTLSYQLSDEQGAFVLDIPAEADTLIVSRLGFSRQSFPKPFSESYRIVLVPAFRNIKEAVVTARKIEMEGDTLRFDIKGLKIQEDQVLSEVLNRLPGVEVSPAGHIKYYGQAINRLYVDGRDLLGSSYNLVVKNMSIDAVKSVEVFENHQPVNMLRGVKPSEKAALNLVLDESAKERLTGTVRMGIGVAAEPPRFPLSARLSSFYMGSVFSSTNVLGYDSSGHAFQDAEQTASADRSYNHYKLKGFLNNTTPSAPLEDRRVVFNRTLDVGSVNHVSLSQEKALNITVKYAGEKRSNLVSEQSVYEDPGEDGVVIDRTGEYGSAEKNLSGILTFTNNASRHYLFNKLYADIGRADGSMAITGGNALWQQSEGKKWNVENEASVAFRRKNKVYSLSSLTQFSGMGEHLVAAEVKQAVDSRVFVQRLSVEGLSLSRKGWSFSLTPEAEAIFYRRISLLENLPENEVPGLRRGHPSTKKLQGGLSAEVRHKASPWDFLLRGSAYYAFYHLQDIFHEGHLLGNASADMKYVTGRWEASLGGLVSLRGPENLSEYGDAVILTGYNTLWRGRATLLFTPNWGVHVDLKYREPLSGWSGFVRASWNASKGASSAREIYDAYFLGANSGKAYGLHTISLRGELSKGIYAMNGKLLLSVDYAHSSAIFEQNGHPVGYDSDIASPVILFSSSLFRWWGVSADIRADIYRYSAEKVPLSQNVSVTAKIKNTFRIGKTLSASISSDIYYHPTIGKTLALPDVSVLWKGKRGLRLQMEASNLLNLNSYSCIVLSPLLKSLYTYKIRPFSFSIGASWQF